ncbi:AsmA-like C-terminal region-containing protein [Aurantimonas sp. A2-1-M11]|uniref:AsmA family protein n=1 Tax=Aurantimonas sp. A2-1-M11 TaxID=3113712 RepID=UPI002F93218C
MARKLSLDRLALRADAPGARRRGSKRLGLAAVGAVLAAFALAAFIIVPRLAVDAEAARADLVDRLETMTGQTVAVEGEITFSLLPQTRLTARHVRIGTTDAFSIGTVVADLDLVDAMTGTATVSRVVLVRPEWRPLAETDPAPIAADPVLVPAANGMATPHQGGPLEGPRHLVRTLIERFHGLQTLEIRSGVFRPRGGNGRSGISNANLIIAQSSASAAMYVAGSFIWNGQPSDLDLRINSPSALLEDEVSDVELALSSPPLTVSFDGEATLDRNATITGALRLAAPSLSRSIEWLGEPRPHTPDIGPVAIDGTLLLASNLAGLQDTTVTVAGSRGYGVMEAEFGGAKPRVRGTLAFETLDFDPLTRAIAPLPRTVFDFNRPIDLAFARDIDLDVRLSAGRASFGQVPLTDIAAVIALDDGIAKLDIGDAQVFGGRGQANLTFHADSSRPKATGSLSLTGVDSDALLSSIDVATLGVGGRSDLSFSMETPVVDWETIIRNVRIDGHLTARAGAIRGLDPRVLASPGARPLLAGTKGTTIPFDTLNVDLSATGPRLRIDGLEIANGAGLLTGVGSVSAQDESISLLGTYSADAQQTASAEREFTTSKPVAFILQGQWPNPSVTTR